MRLLVYGKNHLLDFETLVGGIEMDLVAIMSAQARILHRIGISLPVEINEEVGVHGLALMGRRLTDVDLIGGLVECPKIFAIVPGEDIGRDDMKLASFEVNGSCEIAFL